MPFANQPLLNLLGISTLTLATTGPGGEPHGAAVYFAADEKLQLYFFSSQDSQHIQNVVHNNQAAISFYPECWGWKDIRGVQMRGFVQGVAPGLTWERGWVVYKTKFPFVKALKSIIAKNQLYVFIPRWIRLVDNRKGFGFKQEWTLP
jgi:uncharacterized protein YhbP (UPF0306 family)